MRRPVLIANLQSSAGAPASVAFHDIERCMQKHSSEIQGYYHVPSSQERPQQANWSFGEMDAKYDKALTKGLKSATRALELVSCNVGDSRSTAKIHATGCALVGGPPCEGHALRVEGITSFQEIQFQFPTEKWNQSYWASSHYLHFSSPVAQIAPGSLFSEDGKTNWTNVTILSGICLFSARLLESSTPDDSSVHVQKLRYGRPTLYEVEYIARAAPVIADFAALLDANARRAQDGNPFHSGVSLDLCLDVPSFHYYQSLEERLQNHSCTFTEAVEWMNEVEKRHAGISSVFRNYIIHELARRGCTSLGCQILLSPFADRVSSMIRQSLEDKKLPSLDSVLHTISIQVPSWKRFYDLIPEKEKPQDFRALGYLFYVFQVVRPALLGNLPSTPPATSPAEMKTDLQSGVKRLLANQQKLLISIDDAAERRIYSRAQKILKRSRMSTGSPTAAHLLEVYMCRRVFINGNMAGSNLYLDDPSQRYHHRCVGRATPLVEKDVKILGVQRWWIFMIWFLACMDRMRLRSCRSCLRRSS